MQTAKYKAALLEWVTEADFTDEISLTQLANHKFRLDPEEAAKIHGNEGILKICKVMMYKIGLSYKRQEIFKAELMDEIKRQGK